MLRDIHPIRGVGPACGVVEVRGAAEEGRLRQARGVHEWGWRSTQQAFSQPHAAAASACNTLRKNISGILKSKSEGVKRAAVNGPD